MRFSVALICVMVIASGCGPSERERFEATEKLLSAWDKDIKGSRADYIRILISEGANVNVVDDDWTPLRHTCWDGDLEIATLLIEAGANVNAENKHGWTPLSAACTVGDLEMVTLLIEAGADVNAKNMNGNTPLHVACSEGRLEIATLLIEEGADVNAKNKRGNTPLRESGIPKIIKLLKAAGAKE